jgi:hypothetical protein
MLTKRFFAYFSPPPRNLIALSVSCCRAVPHSQARWAHGALAPLLRAAAQSTCEDAAAHSHCNLPFKNQNSFSATLQCTHCSAGSCTVSAHHSRPCCGLQTAEVKQVASGKRSTYTETPVSCFFGIRTAVLLLRGLCPGAKGQAVHGHSVRVDRLSPANSLSNDKCAVTQQRRWREMRVSRLQPADTACARVRAAVTGVCGVAYRPTTTLRPFTLSFQSVSQVNTANMSSPCLVGARRTKDKCVQNFDMKTWM